MDLPEIWCKVVDWFQLAQGEVQWRVSMNMITNFRASSKRGITWLLNISFPRAITYHVISYLNSLYDEFCLTVKFDMRSRESSVSIMTKLQIWCLGFYSRYGQNFSSPPPPVRIWDLPSNVSDDYRGSFSGDKAVGAWSWQLTCI
jgi:hypothetical protein